MRYKKITFALIYLATSFIMLPMNDQQFGQKFQHALIRCKSVKISIPEEHGIRRSASAPIFQKLNQPFCSVAPNFFDTQSSNNNLQGASTSLTEQSSSPCEITPTTPVSAMRMFCLHLLLNNDQRTSNASTPLAVDEDQPFDIAQFIQSPNYQLFKLCQNKKMPTRELMHTAIDLLDQGANPNFSCYGTSLLTTAIMHAQAELVDLLLAYGVIPKKQDIDLTKTRTFIQSGGACSLREQPNIVLDFDKDKHALQEILETLKKKITLPGSSSNNA